MLSLKAYWTKTVLWFWGYKIIVANRKQYALLLFIQHISLILIG